MAEGKRGRRRGREGETKEDKRSNERQDITFNSLHMCSSIEKKEKEKDT